MADWDDGYWWSADGLRLHYRDYPGTGVPIICIPGLTRNARDFAEVAERLAGRHRLILVELRGRGESAYAKDPMSYVPLTYLQDVQLLIDELKLERFVLFGTSLGGLISSLLAMGNAGRLAGALINDVGPVIDPAGMARIRSYVGKSISYPTWLHAARGIAETQATNFPDNGLHDWLAMAKRLCRLTPAGRIVFDYDMAIAEPFRVPGGGEPGVDMWPVLNALMDIPTLLVRGALSDLLKPETAARMLETLPQMEEVVIARVGHTPTLSEPPSIAGIDRLLDRIAAAG